MNSQARSNQITVDSAAERQFNLQAIFDSSSNAVIAIDREGIVLMYNPIVEKALLRQGVTVQKGRNIFDLLQGDELSFWLKNSKRAIAGERVSVEREYDTDDGKRLIRFVIFPLYEHDEIIGACLTSEDVTKEREIALALERSEADHRRLFNENPLPIWIVDRETFQVLHVNRAMCKLYGYSKEEFLQMNILKIRTEESRNVFLREHAHLVSGETDATIFAKHQKKNGDIIEVCLYTHPITFDGRPARIALIQDVTKQQKAERELRAANERFRLASEAVTSVVYDMDRRTDHFTTSSSFKKLTGFDPEKTPDILTGSWWISRIHPQDKDEVNAIVADANVSKDRYDVEYRVRHKNGKYIYVWHRGLLVRDDNGAVVRVIGNVQDITGRKKMEAQLITERNNAIQAKESADEMNRLKSNFLANMSHELRTPMTAVLGFSQLISEASTDPEIRNYASTIETSARRLLETLNVLLDHARIESNKVVIRPSKVDVNVLVQETCHLLGPLALERAVELRTFVQQTDGHAVIDPEHLRTIATNVIGNAIKFTSEGSISVRTFFGLQAKEPMPLVTGFATHVVGHHPKGDLFAIVVQDTGAGIERENLAMIFEEFKQESHGYSRTHEGNGLGLTISSRLAIAMGGSIEVRSAKGVGSTFIIRLPMNAG